MYLPICPNGCDEMQSVIVTDDDPVYGQREETVLVCPICDHQVTAEEAFNLLHNHY